MDMVSIQQTKTAESKKRNGRTGMVMSLKHSILQWIILLLLVPHGVESRNTLIRWLDHLRIRIPDQSFEADYIRLHINDMVCTHFAIGHIQSNVDNNSNELHFTVRDVRAVCQGSYRTNIRINGDVTATIGGGDSCHHHDALEWTFRMIDDTASTVFQPKGVKTTSCQLGLALTHLHFEHGLAKLANLFKGMIQDAVNKQLACDNFQALIDEEASRYIALGMEWLTPYISPTRTQHVSPRTRPLLSPPTPIPSRVSSLLKIANDFVGYHLNQGFLPNATHCGGFAAGINGLLANHDNRLSLAFPVNVHNVSLPQDFTLDMVISDWAISGLHDWQDLVVLRPQEDADNMFHTQLSTPSNVSLAFRAAVNVLQPHNKKQNEPLTEVFQVNLSMTSLHALLGTELVMANDTVSVGSISKALHNITHFFPCFGFKTIRLMDPVVVDMDLGDITVQNDGAATEDPTLEEEVDKLITDALTLLVHRYPELVTRAAIGLIHGPGVKYVNNLLEDTLNERVDCTTSGSGGYPFTNFSKTPLPWINQQLNGSLSHLNDFIDCNLEVVGHLVSPLLPGATVDIQHVGSLQELRVLEPANATLMSSAVQWGGGQLPPSITANVTVPQVLNSSVRIQFQGEAQFYLDIVLSYDKNRFQSLDLANVLTECAARPIEDLQFPFISGSVDTMEIVSIVNIFLQGNRTVELAFNSSEFTDFSSTFQDVVQWLMDTGRDGSVWASSAAVRAAHRVCHEEDGADDQDQLKGPMILILSTLFVLAQPLILLMKRPQNSSVNDASSNNGSQDLLEPLISETFQEEFALDDDDSSSYPSLMNQTGYMTRHVVPVLIFFTMGLFLASNMSVGASVEMVSDGFRIPSIHDFGLINTAKAMLGAKVYPLFLLVILFSGLWPYVKLILLLVAWICPEPLLSFEARDSLLTKLDAFSKYSLVDTYVLIVMLVTFRYHLPFLDEAQSLDVYVNPMFGLYGFLFATMISLLIGHVMVHFHRECAPRSGTELPGYESVFGHTYSFKDESCRRLTVGARSAIVLAFFVVLSLLGYGSTRNSFVFRIGGLSGHLLGDKSVQHYSLLSIATAIPRSVESGIGIYLLQASYYIFTVVTPLVAVAALGALLILPATTRFQARMLVVAEVANAWSAIEIFVLSIVAVLFEFAQFSKFIFGSRCDFVRNNLLGDPVCFSITCAVKYNVVFLVAGVLLYSCLVGVSLQLVRACVVERLGIQNSTTSLHRWLSTSLFVSEEQEHSFPPVVEEEDIGEETNDADSSWKEWEETTNVT